MDMVEAKIDRVLYLLLGDKYEAKFTLAELRNRYGYPVISDAALHEMIIDEMPD